MTKERGRRRTTTAQEVEKEEKKKNENDEWTKTTAKVEWPVQSTNYLHTPPTKLTPIFSKYTEHVCPFISLFTISDRVC